MCVLFLFFFTERALVFLHVLCVGGHKTFTACVCLCVFLSFKANSTANCMGCGWIWPPIALLLSYEAQSFSPLYLCPTEAAAWEGMRQIDCILQHTVSWWRLAKACLSTFFSFWYTDKTPIWKSNMISASFCFYIKFPLNSLRNV